MRSYDTDFFVYMSWKHFFKQNIVEMLVGLKKQEEKFSLVEKRLNLR